MILEDEVEDSGNISPESENDGGDSQDNESAADISQHEEVAAKARGWVAKEEFRGRPEDWQDAKSFLDRNSSLQTEVKQLRDRVAEQEETYAQRIKRIEATNDRIIREDRERLLNELARAKREAVELGDIDQYDKLELEETSYFRRQAEAERDNQRQERPEQRQPDLYPETQDWLRRNTWFHETPAMQQIALGFYAEANEGMPAAKDETKRLAYVDKRMAEVYPDKFGSGNRANSVEGGGRGLINKKPVQLTADERAACRRFIQKGIIKNEAEYVKYLNEYDS